MNLFLACGLLFTCWVWVVGYMVCFCVCLWWLFALCLCEWYDGLILLCIVWLSFVCVFDFGCVCLFYVEFRICVLLTWVLLLVRWVFGCLLLGC